MTFDPIKDQAERACDMKTWSPSCKREESSDKGEKYLCSSCGKQIPFEHEIHHEHFPHICGTEGMS